MPRTRREASRRRATRRAVEPSETPSQAKRRARRLRVAQRFESVGRAAGSIAHDFNNLLTAIFGYADLALAPSSSDASRRADLSEILRAAQRAAYLVRKLIAVTQQQENQPALIDLSDTVRHVDSVIGGALGPSVSLVTVPSDDACFVRIDPGGLDHVLISLATNAREAMPEGGTLMVTAAHLDPVRDAEPLDGVPLTGPVVALSVEDTGVGMDAAVLARAAEPFVTSKKDGAGLGLATSQAIVKRAGGHMRITSARDKGTTVTIYLPRALSADLNTLSGGLDEGSEADASIGASSERQASG